MEKLYMLKDEVKDHLSPHCEFRDSKLSKDDWYNLHDYNESALKEVEQKIKITASTPISIVFNKALTKQQREDVERLLNLGGFDGLEQLTVDWWNKVEEDDTTLCFTDWLKK